MHLIINIEFYKTTLGVVTQALGRIIETYKSGKNPVFNDIHGGRY